MRLPAAAFGLALVLAACGGGGAPRARSSSTSSPDPNVGRLNALAVSAGCSPLLEPPEEGANHISPPQKGGYRTSPPSSGPHYGVLAQTGVHRDPIPNENQVHNLEHGHVGIQYRAVASEIVAELEEIARSDPQWIFVAPYPAMGHAVALTAWGRLLTCDAPGAQVAGVASAFVEAFRDRAPESIPGTPAS